MSRCCSAHAPAQLGDRLLAAQPFQDYPDLLFGGILLRGRTSDCVEVLLGTFFLAHRYSPLSLDEPDLLRQLITATCLIGDDGEQKCHRTTPRALSIGVQD